jgi:hypothetical protein
MSDELKPDSGGGPLPASKSRKEPSTRPDTADKVFMASLLFLSILLIGIAAFLRPDQRGYGTHEQLRFVPPCGFKKLTGLPCPSCGMTTAFAYMAHGQFFKAAITHPYAAMLFVLLAITGIASLAGLIFNWPLPTFLGRHEMKKLWLALVLVFLAYWVLNVVLCLVYKVT